jgi:hypothetical protein
MGETGVSEIADVAGFAINPASIPYGLEPQIGLSYGGLVQGISSSVISIAALAPLGDGISIPTVELVGTRFGVGIAFDHQSLELSQGSGWGTETIGAGFGYRITPYASVGLLAKFLFSNTGLQGTGVSAFGLDVSSILEFSRTLRLGLAVRNVPGTASWDDGENESLPLLFALGGTVRLPRDITAQVDVTASGSDRTRGGLGVDVPVLDTGFSVRAGYLYHSGGYTRNIPTFGFGFAYASVQIDYAARFDDGKALGTTHHFSLAYTFGP